MNDRITDKNTSIFEGKFWRKYSYFASADIFSCLIWFALCFPFLVLLTEKSNGDRVQLQLSELFSATSIFALSLALYLQVGRFMSLTFGSAVSLASGLLIGVIIAAIARRPSWILVSTSLFFFTSIIFRVTAFLF